MEPGRRGGRGGSEGQPLLGRATDVRLWNTATRQAPHASIPADTGALYGVRGVAFSPGGKLLASADANGTVRLWDPATGQAIGPTLPAEGKQVPGVRNVPLEPDVNGVAFSPNGKLLASADADGTVQTWQMSLFADPYAALCADVGPPTRADWPHTLRVSRSPGFAVDARLSAAHVAVSDSPLISAAMAGSRRSLSR